MTPSERFERAAELFSETLDLPAAEQQAYLVQACAGDTGLLDEVTQLLQSAGPSRSVHAEELVGRYRVIRELGRGGMGVVHLAVRDDDYEQVVALKRFQGDVALGKELVEQFRRERQILARLQHPGIVQLLDGGSTALGRPYLVTQYVEGGIHLDQYCRQNQLTLPARVELVLKICDAVHYAHQKTVVHRDLKPNNILVTAPGEPRLLDFGLANDVTESKSRQRKEERGEAWEIGTLGYASPEQLRGLPSDDVRTDVYALGAILFEVLTGVKANAAGNLTREQFIERVCTQDPALPSEAALRGEMPQWSAHLRGDLDAIVRKAMARDIDQRYGTVEKLVSDLHAWTEHRPVSARKHSASYVFGRFVRRRRGWVAAAAALLTVGAVSLTTYVRQEREVMRADARAVRSLDEMRALARKVIQELHDAIEDIPGAADARRALLRTASEALEKLANDAQSDPRYRVAIGVDLASAYIRMGDLQSRHSERDLLDLPGARGSYEKAIALLAVASSDAAVRVLQARCHERMAELEVDQPGGVPKARERMEQARGLLAGMYGPDAGLVQSLLERIECTIARRNGQSEAAHRAIERAMDAGKRVRDEQPKNREYQRELDKSYDLFAEMALRARWLPPAGHAGTWNILSAASITGIRKAYTTQNDALQQAEARLQADPRNFEETRRVARSHRRLGTLALQLGETSTAVKSYRTALSQFERLLNASPASFTARQDAAVCRMELAETLMQVEGQSRPAFDYATEALRTLETLPANAEIRGDIARVMGIAGNLQYRHGQFREAFASFEKAGAIHRELLASDSRNLALEKGLMLNYRDTAYLHDVLDRTELALKEYGRAVELGDRILKSEANDPELKVAVASARNDRGNTLSMGRRDMANARVDLDAARKLLEPVCSEKSGPFPCRFELGITYSLIGRLLQASPEKAAEAQTFFRRGTALFEQLSALDPENRDVRSKFLENQVSYAQSIARTKLNEAVAVIEKAMPGFETLQRRDPADYATRVNIGFVHSFLAEAYRSMKKTELALEQYAKCAAMLSRTNEHATEGGCHLRRGRMLVELKNWSGAKVDLEKAFALLTDATGRSRVHAALAQMHEGEGDVPKAVASAEAALKLAPENKVLKEDLDRLRKKQTKP
ncbi:MAG: protein kinase [Acidobacteria bacterium]|nr:protein kinase [Acidobacteriota bacterium]